MKWNNRSREAEGNTLIAEERARALKRFPELATEFESEGLTAIKNHDKPAPFVLPQWLMDKYK